MYNDVLKIIHHHLILPAPALTALYEYSMRVEYILQIITADASVLMSRRISIAG